MAQQDSIQEAKLDVLFNNVLQFRSSKFYRDMMKMCGKFRHLSPYNTMLVNMQKPLARYVLKREEWERKYHRQLKPNAQPLIILMPFGPIGYLFEIGDTEPENAFFPISDDDILESIARPFRTKRNVHAEDIERLMELCAFHGVTFDMSMNAGVDFGAKIELLKRPALNRKVAVRKKLFMDLAAPYLISVNKTASSGEQMSAIVHELGHLFCHHLLPPQGWKPWEVRHLPHNVQEFEAESVAWLICERLNIGNPSEAYLSDYLDENDMIPNGVSIEAIFHAFSQIWDILRTDKRLSFTNAMLYNQDPIAKRAFDRLKQKENQAQVPKRVSF